MRIAKKRLSTIIANTGMSTLAAAIVVASPLAQAEIELGKGFSVTGFIDMSFVYFDPDVAGVPTSRVFGVDQVETNFMYKGPDGVSAQVDIEYGESGDGSGTDETFVEQAFITKQVTDNFSVKAGRFLSYSGWETEEPTGLFQYSGTGYAPVFYGYYQQGVSGYLDLGMVDLAVSVVNDAFANPIEADTTQLGTELMFAISPVDSFTAKAFYITEGDKESINLWASYSFADMTLAAEFNTAEDTTGVGDEADGFLLMANYAPNAFGITLRYHEFEIEDSLGATFENSAITLAPSYAVSDNLLLVSEFRFDSFEQTGFADADTDTFALEALYTF